MKNSIIKIKSSFKKKTFKQDFHELLTALKYCSHAIHLLSEESPDSMNIYLKLAHRHSLVILRKHGSKTEVT